MTIHVTKDNFEKEVMSSELPVVLDFWAAWCGPCRMMAPVFEELSKEYEGKIKFGKVNTEEEQMLASMFQVQSIPTLSIVHGKHEIGRLIGFMPKAALKKNIEELIAGHKH